MLLNAVSKTSRKAFTGLAELSALSSHPCGWLLQAEASSHRPDPMLEWGDWNGEPTPQEKGKGMATTQRRDSCWALEPPVSSLSTGETAAGQQNMSQLAPWCSLTRKALARQVGTATYMQSTQKPCCFCN